ncbi:MAG: dihydroorotase [Candidatus Cloacimonadales bacterium]|jgi:dihydroorotase|nr:dihydroorotase [Candidatus Cloacimonadota bacterium]MDX9976643.1 dihydroorotase [Candidatus Cloacimonadales bacterium]
MKILIKNANAYINETWVDTDVLIDNNKIARVEKNIKDDADKIIDATGKKLIPGFVDLHCHLRDPGQTYKEDIHTGTKAAAKGGYTTICAMPNTEPTIDNIGEVEYVQRKANDLGLCKVKVIGASSKKLEGKEIAEIATMKEGGIVAVSDDGACVQNAKLQSNIMLYAQNFDIPVIVHAEDYNMAGKGQIAGGKVATKLGLAGIPALAEEIIIARDIMLAESTKCHLHIAHLSTANSVDMIRIAKKEGIKVTTEVTPHHLIFNEERLVSFDTNFKCKPAIRSEKDRQALIQGLIDGTIDMIATDHAPHADFEKDKEFDFAPFGVIGFETAFAGLYTHLVMKNLISLELLIDKLSVSPANWLKLNAGAIEVGRCADLVITDLNKTIDINKNTILSKSKNSPFLGETLYGKIDITICEGKITYNADE